MSLNLTDIIDNLSIEVEQGVRYCFDDSYIVNAKTIESNPLMLTRLPRKVYVDQLTPALKQYNRMSLTTPILEKHEFDMSGIQDDVWKIPDRYQELTLADIISILLEKQVSLGFPDDLDSVRSQRIIMEMRAYNNANNLDMIRLMMYVIDTFESTGQIWGVGRGSSVSSYVLFLIGVHDIDSVEYDLDFTDFMKP